tara:strand:- start:281 stop:556 length:276 start_codon:yes stop_codon:yes gene_type:complete
MQTVNETILTTVVNTMVERNKALEVQLAAVYEELAESRREFNVVEGALDFWQSESERKQDLLTKSMADLKIARIVISEYNKFYDRKEGVNQ